MLKDYRSLPLMKIPIASPAVGVKKIVEFFVLVNNLNVGCLIVQMGYGKLTVNKH